MINIKPFKALRPEAPYAKQVASKPYDVLNSKEARIEAQGNPNSFLHITKSEIDLPEDIDTHSQQVYDKAKENLTAFISRNVLFTDIKECYYVYQLIMNDRSQTGLVCVSSIADYENNQIKKHEFTRPEKEKDRIDHMKTIGAQTGNVFLAYKNDEELDKIIENWKKERSAVYDFVADDAVQHTIWIINDTDTINAITSIFKNKITCTYIADGHHRAASAAKVSTAFDTIDAQYFLTTLFPSNQLKIMDYNRVVKDLNGLNEDDFIKAVKKNFSVRKSTKAVLPNTPHQFGMYINNQWYVLAAKENTFTNDPIGVLDVTIISNNLLDPILGIKDQRTDSRIDFVGGIRGLEELEKRVNSGEMAVAFSIHPVSIQQLFDIADTGNVMPPKSTWFEPKLRDGLLTHVIEEQIKD